MLEELHVTNLALISDVTLEPARGLTALTGETGAGKSALLSAVKLLIGERASGDAVRDGSEGLSVEGIVVRAQDAQDYPDGRVVTRRVSAEGRSRCTVDGALVTVSQLAEVVGSTVDLVGQHDHQRLLSPANHLLMLDAWAGQDLAQAQAAYRVAWDARARAAAELDRVLAARSAEARRVEDARFALARIDEVDPKPGEYEELEATLPRLEHAEALATGANEGYEAISSDGGAVDMLNEALSSVEAVSRFDPELEKISDALREMVFPLEDIASDLRRYRDDADFDPEALERAQTRMAELGGIKRMFGPTMEQVFERRAEAQELVDLVDGSERLEKEARQALDETEATLTAAAKELSARRDAAAPEFAAAVSAQMGRLQMSGANLLVKVERLARAQWSASGADRVTFLYRPGEGMAPRPFAKIASGGEVSRVMLSIKVALGANDDVDTLIFDEIDAGVGGETARAVADVLADLARTHQVIVVSHLAQIAVRAQRHYVVRKRTSDADGLLETCLELVDGQDRVLEIARMLSGDSEQASIDHARILLQEAHDADDAVK